MRLKERFHLMYLKAEQDKTIRTDEPEKDFEPEKEIEVLKDMLMVKYTTAG